MYESRGPARAYGKTFHEVTAVAALEAGAPSPEDTEVKRRGRIIAQAKKRFRHAVEADQENRQEALKDLEFYIGEQWEPEVKNDRFNAGRPCLTIDRIRPTVKMVVNEIRQQRPSIQVNPVGDKADVKIAEIEEGIVRHIQVASDAEVAYDHCSEMATAIGRGSFRFITEYESDSSFNQEIRVKRILNPFSVYWDPSAVEPDKADAIFCFITEDVDTEEYKVQYPDSDLASLTSFKGVGDESYWFPDGNKIRLAEYFSVEREARELALLADGTTCWIENVPEGSTVLKTRRVQARRIHWYKMNAVEILEERVLPGQFIPVITMQGDEVVVDGKRMVFGLVRTMRDAQRMYNIARSGAVESVLLSPRAPWVIAEGQIEGHEEEWRLANNRNMAVLTYKPIDVSGQPVPPPIRNQWEPPIVAMTQLMAQADNDLKATSGIYDASLGAPGPEQSGKAILARQQQGNTATFGFIDNVARTMRHAGRVLLSMIPEVYDVPRIVRILKPDGTAQMLPINQHFQEVQGEDGQPKYLPAEQELPGITKIYDVTVGDYDVTVDMGPSYQTRRKEAVTSILELVEHFPPIMQIAGDLLVGNMDWPFAQEIAKRMKTMLPPAIQQLDQGDGQQQKIDPSVVMQQQSVIQQLQQLLQQMQQERQAKVVEGEYKLELERVKGANQMQNEQMRLETQAAIAEINTKSQQLSERMKWVQDLWAQLHNQAHEAGLQAMDQSHEQNLAQQDQAHQVGMAQQQQAHDRALAEQQAQAQQAQAEAQPLPKAA